MKTCVFCGEPGGTREHITSTAVQKRMQLSGVEIEIGVREASAAPCARRPHAFRHRRSKPCHESAARG